MSPKTLLDSDILSSLMRRDPNVLARSVQYLSEYPQLSFSLITRFEILRGLKARAAAIKRVMEFDRFCATCEILSISEETVVRASDIYADLYRRGQLIGDADILISATALTNDLALATNNAAHFARIPGLTVVNWSA
jgi:tRNA(fMet)-specific endonuclease VapC